MEHLHRHSGSAAAYGEDPIKFFFNCKEKVRRFSSLHMTRSQRINLQYGNVFTFILMGRRVTVALTPAGNNFIMGGKHTTFSAEDVYTVSSLVFLTGVFLRVFSI